MYLKIERCTAQIRFLDKRAVIKLVFYLIQMIDDTQSKSVFTCSNALDFLSREN